VRLDAPDGCGTLVVEWRFAIIARAAGLVGHVHEEQQDPSMRSIWEAAEAAIPSTAAGPATSASAKSEPPVR
jgi:hypothetical protein